MHYYQHHIGDFVKDTSHLNDHQLATYLRMLWAYYSEEKPFDGDIEAIAFAMRSDEKTVRLLLKHFFKQHNDVWVHSRCEREISEYHAKRENARNSANARWNNANAMRTHSECNAKPPKTDANQEPITNNQEPKEKTISRAARSTASRPAEIPEPLWLDYLAVRADKRAKTFTSTALAGIQREAALAGISLEAAMTECVERGWIGFKASWHNRDEYRPPHASMKKTNADLMRETVQRLSRKIYDEASPEDRAEFDEEMRQQQRGGNVLCLPSVKV